MLFNSYTFILLFLPITLIFYHFSPFKNLNRKTTLIAIFSLIFYGYWNISFLPVLILSICVNYCFSEIICRTNKKYKLLFLVIAIILNLGTLFFFKYTNFLIDNINFLLLTWNYEQISNIDVVLPVGISFFTFTQIVFLIDKYQLSEKNVEFWEYASFVSFFPQLIAGPFLYHKDFMPQLTSNETKHVKSVMIRLGIFLFTFGLAKKVLIADNIAFYVDQYFNSISALDNAFGFIAAWCATIGYTLQIYFDFSGYSDMALGLGLLFFFRLPINFNSPFQAKNMIDYWQRWHMTLTGYIGRYVFTPLALSYHRKSIAKGTAIKWIYNVVAPNIIVFGVIGLWHGSSWNYVFWGIFHGLLLVINQTWRATYVKSLYLSKFSKSRFFDILAWFLTFICICLSFVLFRTSSLTEAYIVYDAMLNFSNLISVNASAEQNQHWLALSEGSSISYLLLIFFSLCIALFTKNHARLMAKLDAGKINEVETDISYSWKGPILLGSLLIFILINMNKISVFLYFQF